MGSDLRARYNKGLAIEVRLEGEINDRAIPIEERRKLLPEYDKIVDGLNKLLRLIGEDNYTDDEVLNGFKLD